MEENKKVIAEQELEDVSGGEAQSATEWSPIPTCPKCNGLLTGEECVFCKINEMYANCTHCGAKNMIGVILCTKCKQPPSGGTNNGLL
jgi:hypothetical protein